MKKLLIFLLLMVSSVGFLGCSRQAPPPPPEKVITIGVMPDVGSIPLVIAEKNGYFQKEGVQVKIEPFNSAKDRDSALQGGKLDGVLTDMLAVVFANEGGIKLKMVAKAEGNVQLLAGKDSGINSLKEIAGRSVGLSTNTVMEYTVDKMLASAAYQPEAIKKIAIPQIPARLEMLQGNKVDAAILTEPQASLAIKNGAKVLSSTDQLANNVIVLAFSAQTLEQNPEQVRAVIRAYNDAVDYLRQEPSANYIDFLIQKQGFPAEVKDTLQLPRYGQAALPSEQLLADVVQWLQAKNLIKGNYAYKDLVDGRFLR